MQSPPYSSGRALAPSTLRRVRRGRICRPTCEHTISQHTTQMGQGNSTPQQDDRDMSGSPHGDDGGQGTREERTIPISTQLRRSRRIRNSITQLGGRLMRSGSSSSISHGASSSTGTSNRVQNSRTRSRMGLSHSRSSPPLPSSGSLSPRRPLSMPLSPSTVFSSDTQNEPEPDTDQIMSDSPEIVTPPYTPDMDTTSVNSPVVSDPSVRRSRLARVRSSISTTLPNLLAELGNSRGAGNASRRNSQFRPGLFEPFGVPDFDDDMDLGGPSSAGINTEQTSRRPHSDFSPFGDPNTMDLLENPRVRPGEDQAAMLSRLLSVAAAMTAASLVGSSEQAFTEAQDVAGDSVDGSFESFLRALQNGRLAAALRNGGNEMGGGVTAEPSADGNLAPLNFFRMFRFGASNATNQTSPETTENPPTRMVPVIIVGIRSVTPRESTNPTEPAPSPLMEQLASFSGRRRAGGNRRASMSAVGDNQRPSGRATRPVSEVLFPTSPSIPDTPQGPHPPPSTPADLGLYPGLNSPRNMDNPSLLRPDRRQSGTHGVPPIVQEDGSRSGTASRDSNTNTNSGQRRQGGEGTRSWIIYVLGGSYPENHPILTTPSLFTDSPTYEDMMLLSSLLGPAKPPVASREDIETAGGLFTVGDSLPTETEGDRNFGGKQFRRLPDGDRCLVCLSEYEAGEECRSLTQCRHVFHRECIDTWLTTGRNSCPLCRGQGVEEKEKDQPPVPVNS